MNTIPSHNALNLLSLLGQEFHSLPEMDTFLARILSLLEKVGNYRHCSLFLLDKSGSLVLRAAQGCRAQQRRATVFRNSLAEMIKQREPVLISDVEKTPELKGYSCFGEGSILMMPLRVEDEVVGLLLLESKHANTFTEKDTQLLKEIAPHLATAIKVAQLFQQFQQAASQDGLTGLHNQRYFYQRLEEELARAQRQRSPLCIALVDIDEMKKINDLYGHLAGDQVLKIIGQVLRANLRASDVVVRYGGDEFALVLPDTSKEAAEAIMQRLVSLLDDTLVKHGWQTFPLPSRSYGIGCAPEDGSTSSELFVAADRALYRHKSKNGSSPLN